jgi:oxygen-independent coproporphyrinogen-3 oxidase
MIGLPGQTAKSLNNTIDILIGAGINHISAYCLSIERGTVFFRCPPPDLPGEDDQACLFESAVDILRAHGFVHYEISNFALPGYACRHNLNYWDRGEYLGLGPGAWSFVGDRRYANIADVHEYVSRLRRGISAVDGEEFPSREQAASEILFLGLRRTSGIDLGRYQAMAGAAELVKLEERVRDLDRAGLLKLENGVLSLTPRGILLANEALARLIT